MLSQSTYHVHYNSGFGTAAPTRLCETSGQEWGAAQRQHTNTSVTPGKWLSARRDGVRWGEICLCGFLEGRRLPCLTTDFQTPPRPPPDLSFPTQQSPGTPLSCPEHTWPAGNASKLAASLRAPGGWETMSLWVTCLGSSVLLSSESGNQMVTRRAPTWMKKAWLALAPAVFWVVQSSFPIFPLSRSHRGCQVPESYTQ